MTVPTGLRRASFILDSDALNPAYLEHSNKTNFYRISPVKLQVLKELVTEMLAENILKRSSSAWASLEVLVPKKKVGKPRICVNYIKLKAKTHTDDLTTNFTRILDRLAASEVFFTIDPESLCWQCPNGWAQQR